ncbi:MAG: hypothetical protein V1659_03105 [Candidatus Woesearchaeota archaeon]
MEDGTLDEKVLVIEDKDVSRPYPRERPKKDLSFLGWSDRADRARNLEFRRVKIKSADGGNSSSSYGIMRRCLVSRSWGELVVSFDYGVSY